jgi:hypothetical protein
MATSDDDSDALRDEIVDEVRAVRRAHAEAHGFDIARIVADLKQKEVASGDQLVSLPPRPVRRRRMVVASSTRWKKP